MRSKLIITYTSIPQCTFLGHSLFLVYTIMKDILYLLLSGNKLSYADDTMISCTSDYLELATK